MSVSRCSRLLAASLLAACGAGAGRAPVAPASARWSPTLQVRAADLPGRLALAPSPQDDDSLPYWIPVDLATVVIPTTDPPVSFGAPLLAVPLEGEPVEVRPAGSATISYGCDGGTLEVERFQGDAPLPPGPVWLLPAPLAAGWRPTGVALQATAVASERRAWSAGPLRVELERRDAVHAALSVAAGDRRLWGDSAEKHYMEGAEENPIDLTSASEIGMPMPAAVFRLAPDGPAVMVFVRSGYESVRLHAVLLDATGGAPLPDASFDLGLYFCAF